MAELFAVEDDLPRLRPGIDVTDLSKPVHVYDIRALDGDSSCISAVTALNNGFLVVFNEASKIVHVYNSDKQHICQFDVHAPSDKAAISLMQKDHKSNLIFGTFEQKYFFRYNLNGNRLPMFRDEDKNFDGAHIDSHPCGLVVDQDGLMIVCHSYTKTNLFDLTIPTATAQSFYSGADFKNIGSLCLGPDGLLYATGANSLTVLDKSGSICKKFEFEFTPEGLFVSGNGDIFTTDYDSHMVCVLSPKGELIHSFGGKGDEEGCFFEPVGITVGYDGYLYVADSRNGRVQVF